MFDAQVNRLFHYLVLVYHEVGIMCVEFDQDGQCKDSVIVAVKQNNMLATAFHPELTSDLRWYVVPSLFPQYIRRGMVYRFVSSI